MYKFIVTLVTRPANSLYLGSLAPSQKSPGAKKRKKEEIRGKRERKEKREKKKANTGRKK